ncbi:MAG: hypothetical protein WBO77_01245 [Microgenomates group bacterium]
MNKNQTKIFIYMQYFYFLYVIITGFSYVLGYDQLFDFSKTTSSIYGIAGIVLGILMIVQVNKTSSKK